MIKLISHTLGLVTKLKKMKKISILSIFVSLLFITNSVLAQDKAKSILSKTKISGKGFVVYDYNDTKDAHGFSLKRGYVTIKSQLNDRFSFRYTQDITLKKEGKSAGNLETRIKYLYMKAKLGDLAFLKNTYVEVGLTHVPWIIFEQQINPYRLEGLMFVDRNKIMTSADLGVEFAGLIGGQLDEKYRKEVNKHNAGRYGSFAIGVFNGGGYHAIEKNNGKTFRSRLSIRPLPDIVPGVQLSYGFTYGQVNQSKTDSTDVPIAYAHIGMLSSESKYHKVTAQYVYGCGSYTGKSHYLNAKNESIDNDGFSVFGQFKVPKSNFALFARYDNFKLKDVQTVTKETIICGVSYTFLKNMVLFGYENIKMPNVTTNYYKLALSVSF